MRTSFTWLRTALVLLLVGSACLFVVGSTLERREGKEEPAAAESTERPAGESAEQPATNDEQSESGEHGEGEGGESEQILGVDTESVPLTIAAVLASLALAAAVWRRLRPRLVGVVLVAFGLLFVAGDARELVLQFDEENAGVAVIAAALLVLHLAIAALGVLLALEGRQARAAV